MRLTRLFGALAVLAVLPLNAALGWTVDQTKSHISYVATQMGSPSEGRFGKYNATVAFDPADPAATRAEIVLDMNSTTSGIDEVDREIKKPKWFDTARFPTGKIVLKTLKPAGSDGKFQATASVTIRDVTTALDLPVTLKIATAGSVRTATAMGEARVSRLAFGIGRDEWRDTNIVADEVIVRFTLVATQPTN